MAGGAMWTEAHRPTRLSEIAGQKEAAGSLAALLKEPARMPHLMLAGPAGTGKTTAAMCVAAQALGDDWRDHTLELNASDERGIDMVREKVKRFSRFASLDSGKPFKIIMLDEADEMTSGAQTALRRIIEDAARHCRFIIIANNISKIIPPIQSRCAIFRFSAVPEGEAVARLGAIAKKEGARADAGALRAAYEESRGDMRHAINVLQAAASGGAATAESVRAAAGAAGPAGVAAVVKDALGGRLSEAREGMVELTKARGMSESDFLKYAAAALAEAGLEPARYAAAARVLAEYDYRILSGASPEIQLAAMLAGLGAAE